MLYPRHPGNRAGPGPHRAEAAQLPVWREGRWRTRSEHPPCPPRSCACALPVPAGRGAGGTLPHRGPSALLPPRVLLRGARVSGVLGRRRWGSGVQPPVRSDEWVLCERRAGPGGGRCRRLACGAASSSSWCPVISWSLVVPCAGAGLRWAGLAPGSVRRAQRLPPGPGGAWREEGGSAARPVPCRLPCPHRAVPSRSPERPAFGSGVPTAPPRRLLSWRRGFQRLQSRGENMSFTCCLCSEKQNTRKRWITCRCIRKS